EALSDRIFAGPEQATHRLTDDGDARPLATVLRCETAAANDARSKNVEQIGRRCLEVETAQSLYGIDSSHEQWHHARAERQRIDARGVVDTADRARRLEQTRPQCRLRARVHGETAIVEVGNQNGCWVPPEPLGADVSQAAHEEPRANQQDDGERALRDEQRRTSARALIT